jgi:hypothetical protein
MQWSFIMNVIKNLNVTEVYNLTVCFETKIQNNVLLLHIVNTKKKW